MPWMTQRELKRRNGNEQERRRKKDERATTEPQGPAANKSQRTAKAEQAAAEHG